MPSAQVVVGRYHTYSCGEERVDTWGEGLRLELRQRKGGELALRQCKGGELVGGLAAAALAEERAAVEQRE